MGLTKDNLSIFRRSCDDNVDYPGGDSEKSKQINALMGNIGKVVSVKLIVKFEGERKFVNVMEVKIVE